MKVDSRGSYLVTCSHVIESCKEDYLEITNKKAKLLYQGTSNGIDLAVVYVKDLLDVKALTLCSSELVDRGVLFEINGFKDHRRESQKLEKLNGFVKKISEIHTSSKIIKTYELNLENYDEIEKGYSGSAILLEGTNSVIAVATDKNRNGKEAYAIPITYLKKIWEAMPDRVVCIDEVKYKTQEGDFLINNGLSDNSLALIIAPYQKIIRNLENELSKSLSIEEKLRLQELLSQANADKIKKDIEIAKLNELLENAKYKIVKDATIILEKYGIEKALDFLNNSKTKEQEVLLESNMKEWAEKYRLEVQLLLIKGEYDKAKESYQKSLKFDRNIETLFDYAYFLQSQNYFDEAIYSYKELLLEQRLLAKTNLTVYNPKIARTLTNLAVLYKNTNKIEKAKDMTEKAVKIYRVLVKDNPKVYNADMATALNNLAIFYSMNNEMKKAKKTHIKALKVRQALMEDNPEIYRADLAETLYNLANFYMDDYQVEKAEKKYLDALVLYQVLAKNNPMEYMSNVAAIFNSLAHIYKDNRQVDKAEKVYESALKIYRILANLNPNVYISDVAMTLNNLAILYSTDSHKKEEMEKCSLEALVLYRNLAKKHPKVYLSNVAMILNNLGVFYSNSNQKEEAEKFYIEALEIKIVLGKDNPSRYASDLADTLINLALYYRVNNEMEKAKKFYAEALKIQKDLVEMNLEAYGLKGVNSLVMGVELFSQPLQNLDKADEFLKKFKGVPKAEELLKTIIKLRNRK